jgi:hypothetical protein
VEVDVNGVNSLANVDADKLSGGSDCTTGVVVADVPDATIADARTDGPAKLRTKPAPRARAKVNFFILAIFQG